MLSWPRQKIQCVSSITSWKQFSREVRQGGHELLGHLVLFDNAVLVAGCQRSGTTALTRMLTASPAMTDYAFGHDDELAAALILSGRVNLVPQGRCCFQTTYLNERYPEYERYKDINYKLIWVLRNPYSVVYSMIHNWGRFAFNELFEFCGSTLLSERDRHSFDKYGHWAFSRLEMACLSYCAKSSQILWLMEALGEEKVMVVDYDAMVTDKERHITALCEFTGLPFDKRLCTLINSESVKKSDKLKRQDRAYIKSACAPLYEHLKTLCHSVK